MATPAGVVPATPLGSAAGDHEAMGESHAADTPQNMSSTVSPSARKESQGLASGSGVEVLRSEGLIVRISLATGGVVNGGCVVTLCYGNDAPTPVENFSAQVAVPKHLKMQLGPPSATSLPPEPLPGYGPTMPPITQTLRLSQPAGPPYKPIKVRLRLTYDRAGKSVVEESTIGPESFGGEGAW